MSWHVVSVKSEALLKNEANLLIPITTLYAFNVSIILIVSIGIKKVGVCSAVNLTDD
jgi:hypothetical protein